MEASEPNTVLPSSAEDLSPLEQDVLEEYERLAENMKKVVLFLKQEEMQVLTSDS